MQKKSCQITLSEKVVDFLQLHVPALLHFFELSNSAHPARPGQLWSLWPSCHKGQPPPTSGCRPGWLPPPDLNHWCKNEGCRWPFASSRCGRPRSTRPSWSPRTRGGCPCRWLRSRSLILGKGRKNSLNRNVQTWIKWFHEFFNFQHRKIEQNPFLLVKIPQPDIRKKKKKSLNCNVQFCFKWFLEFSNFQHLTTIGGLWYFW